MKKYLITGYSGFVSGHFLHALESLGKPVEVLGIDIADPGINYIFIHVKATFQKLNLLDKEAVSRVLAEFAPDYILHLASYSSVAYSWKSPAEAFVNNTNIFLNLADQIRILNMQCRLLSVGSSEEYGNITEADVPVTEDLFTKPRSPYAVARVSQEMLSEIYAKNYGIDIVLTRSFNHIGPGQRDIFVISSFAKKLVDIKQGILPENEITVGNISLIRDFVDVRDVVRAYLLLFEKGKTGEIYNICSGMGHSLEAILKKLMAILNVSPKIKVDRDFIRPDDNKIMIGSYKKIREQTGWSPDYSLNQSLEDIISYWSGQSRSVI